MARGLDGLYAIETPMVQISPAAQPDDAERPSKSAAEARVDEIARTSAMSPRERVLQALRLGHRGRALANAASRAAR